MSMKYLSESFDLHGGGLDLVFPHHENEIAQSESASKKPFARYWMHNGFVQVNKEKMGKSLGNFFTAREVFAHVEPEAIRYSLLTAHYRAPYNMEWELDDAGQPRAFPLFEDAERRLEYWYRARTRLEALPPKRIGADKTAVPDELDALEANLTKALDEDLNTPRALALAADFLRAVNELCDNAQAKGAQVPKTHVDAARTGFETLAGSLGLGSEEPARFLERVRDRRARKLGVDPSGVAQRIEARNDARKNKDYALSDQIRDELAALGVELLDGAEGTSWRLSAS
jgi:cysteinyl-tRNA synthetase